MGKHHHKFRRQRPAAVKADIFPITVHDIFAEGYEDFIPLVHQDAHEMLASGAPLMYRVVNTPSRYRLGLRIAGGMGDNWNDGQPTVCRPGRDGEPHFGAAENEAFHTHPDIIHLYPDLVNLAICGNRVYYLADSLIQRMVATELDLRGELLRTPFQCFSMATKSETLVRMILGDRRQHHYRPDMSVNIVVTLHPDPDDPTVRELSLRTRMVVGRQMTEYLAAGIDISEGVRIRDSLKAFLRKSALDSSIDQSAIRAADITDNWFGTSAEHLYRALLNVIIYLSTTGAVLTSVNRANVRPTQSGPNTRLPVTYQEVGSNLTPLYIRPIEAFQVSREAKSSSPNGKSAMTKRVLVAGHWRSWKGEKHLGVNARLLHIEPYWKGPDEAPAANRPYCVE